jgi:hypothetical protein
VRFTCAQCGSPAVFLPEELHDRAIVQCRGCNDEVSTWSLFKRSATNRILADSRGKALTADPLEVDVHIPYSR